MNSIYIYEKVGSMKLHSAQRGFTLIELLVVIGILTVLMAIVLVAVNPSRQFSQANNAKRTSDITTIVNAIHQYEIDNKGKLPAGIPATTAATIANTGVDICAALVSTYTAQMPIDPLVGTYTSCASYNTGYTVVSSANNRVTVAAPNAEMAATITITQ